VHNFRLEIISSYISELRTETASSFKTLVPTYQLKRRHIP